MRIVQLTPGAGPMYCGNCLRDNALVQRLRALGHDVLMVPLYLPLTLDESDQSANVPVFFGGVSVFLEQKFSWFQQAPKWVHTALASRTILKRAAGGAARTNPAQAGELALSMLHGEHGAQARELDALIDWLKTQPKPDVICLSNALLLGSARRLESALGAPVVCMLQGEDSFLDGLPEPFRNACWKALSERGAEIKQFIAPSRYFGELMLRRMGLPFDRLRVVFNGINLEGYDKLPQHGHDASAAASAPVVGFFARMCRQKGLDVLVDAFISLCRRGRIPSVRLKIGGSCGPTDEPVVNEMRDRLSRAGLSERVEFHPNLTRGQKLQFLGSLTVFSVPATYGEAFGLYVIEAMGAGVPVVQPRTAAFPELIEASDGGALCEPGDPESLATQIETLLLDPLRRQRLAENARRAAFEKFSAEAMAQGMMAAWAELKPPQVLPQPARSAQT